MSDHRDDAIKLMDDLIELHRRSERLANGASDDEAESYDDVRELIGLAERRRVGKTAGLSDVKRASVGYPSHGRVAVA